MVAMETTTVMGILISILVNIFKLFKGAKFDYDQIKEENVSGIEIFNFFLFLTTLRYENYFQCSVSWILLTF